MGEGERERKRERERERGDREMEREREWERGTGGGGRAVSPGSVVPPRSPESIVTDALLLVSGTSPQDVTCMLISPAQSPAQSRQHSVNRPDRTVFRMLADYMLSPTAIDAMETGEVIWCGHQADTGGQTASGGLAIGTAGGGDIKQNISAHQLVNYPTPSHLQVLSMLRSLLHADWLLGTRRTVLCLDIFWANSRPTRIRFSCVPLRSVTMRPCIRGRIVTDRNATHEKRIRVGRALGYKHLHFKYIVVFDISLTLLVAGDLFGPPPSFS